MGCKARPNSNATLENGVPGTPYATIKGDDTPGDFGGHFQNLTTVVKSTIPYLVFLMIYGINQQVHILPRFSDIDCVRLHNVSAWESVIFRGFAPHRFISSHHTPFLDVLSAVPYLIHYIIPIIYPLFLYSRRQIEDVCRFYWLLGWAMWILYLIWFLLPTAPPWVYDNWSKFSNSTMPQHHLQHKEGCAFARLDARTGIPFFFNLFASNPVPFASFPSGHVLWPMCIYLTWAPGGKLFLSYVVWMTWATLYSCHHNLIDSLCAVVLVITTKRLLSYLSECRPRDHFSRPAIVCSLNIV